MRGYLWIIILALVAVPFAAAVQGPFNFNGKEYYTVTSTNILEDTGTEVCAKVGKTCVGYTAFGADVCLMAHPGVPVTSSSSGDRSTSYCNGPPQIGVCGSETNTCHTCPTCGTGIECDTPISNLYNEMYVECAGGTSVCSNPVNARSTTELLASLPSINSALSSCTVTVTTTGGLLPKNGNIVGEITSPSGTEYLTVALVNGRVTSVTSGQSACTKKITISRDDLDVILASSDRTTAFQYMYNTRRVTVSGCTFFGRITTAIVNPFARYIAGRALPQAPVGQPVPPVQQGSLQCDFYNAPTKKIVTCAAYKAADTFCVLTMGSAQARAVSCDENGLVLCTVPCNTYSAVKTANRCAFDINRARGTQAPPIGSCPAAPTPAAPTGAGRPANCDETYMNGHSGYAQNKALWDAYASDTDGVCQSQYGRGTPSPCAHTVQLSVSGNPYYLCWYRNP